MRCDYGKTPILSSVYLTGSHVQKIKGADQKMRGHLVKKIALKSKNSHRVSGGGVGAQGQLARGVNWRES